MADSYTNNASGYTTGQNGRWQLRDSDGNK